MRYLITALSLVLAACSASETSTTRQDGGSGMVPDVGHHDAGSTTDVSTTDVSTTDVSTADLSRQPVDMSTDVTTPREDMGPTDASSPDAGFDADVRQDADRPDAGSSDVAVDMTPNFVCPPAKYDGQICIQVIVYVRDQRSGECCQYPTPCHVPEGDWGEERYGSESECSVR